MLLFHLEFIHRLIIASIFHRIVKFLRRKQKHSIYTYCWCELSIAHLHWLNINGSVCVCVYLCVWASSAKTMRFRFVASNFHRNTFFEKNENDLLMMVKLVARFKNSLSVCTFILNSFCRSCFQIRQTYVYDNNFNNDYENVCELEFCFDDKNCCCFFVQRKKKCHANHHQRICGSYVTLKPCCVLYAWFEV